MNPDPKIQYVSWRNGRPRFMPSKTLRDKGFVGEDLKLEDGTWMTAGQALEWSRTFQQQIAIANRNRPAKAKRKPASPVPRPLTRIYPVSQLLEEWLSPGQNPDMPDPSKQDEKIDSQVLRKKTVDEYRYKTVALQKYAPDIFEAEVEALDQEICRGLYDTLRVKAGLPTAVGVLRVLGIAIAWGMSRGRLRGLLVNPAHNLKMKTPDPRLRVGSIAEIDRLVWASDAMGWPEIGDMITFAVWSGQRQADRLLFETAGTRNGRMIFRQAKTGAIVAIKRAPELSARLSAADIRREEKNIQSDRVILNERARKPFQGSYYSHTLLDIRKAAAAGLPDAQGNPTIDPMPSVMTLTDQDFRDTAVTWLARAKCTIPEICAITGHSFKTANEILKHYLELDEEMADSAIDKLTVWHAKERK